MTYSQQLRDPRWQRKRLEVLNAAGWQCSKCHNKRRLLHVHHLVYRPVSPWEYEIHELEALCDQCHRQAHAFLRGKDHFDSRMTYTRRQIQQVLGGPTTGFLPMDAGHVVCGCFRRKYNPDAPDIILPGDFQRIIEPAERFCHQSFPVPIFIYETPHSAWFYKGDYEVSNWTENPTEIVIHNKRANRNNISRVIFLRPANTPPRINT